MQDSTSTTTSCPFCGSELFVDGEVLACICGYAAMVPTSRINLLRSYERAGIPKRYRGAVWEDPRAHLTKEGRGLFLQGTNGTGKTNAAMAVAKECVAAGWSVQVTSGVRILSMLRDSMDGGSAEDVFDKLSKPDLLVIDDMGKENPTEWVVSMLYRVIDERYGSMKTTVVTSNYSKRELVDRLTVGGDSSTAESIVSRLFEMTEKVVIDGEDRRMTA